MAKYFKGITNISLTLELQCFLQIKEKYQCLTVFWSLMINLEGQIQKCQLMPFKKPCLDQYFKQQRSLWELFPSFFQRYETKKHCFVLYTFYRIIIKVAFATSKELYITMDILLYMVFSVWFYSQRTSKPQIIANLS